MQAGMQIIFMETKFKKMIKKIIILFVLFSLCNCKKEQRKLSNLENFAVNKSVTGGTKYECELPNEIKIYFDTHNEFELLSENDLSLINEFIDSSICPIYLKGDFNDNNLEDVAIIVRYKGYKNREYGDYRFPFLIIFNDYKNGLSPHIIYKTGDYKDESVKTVIYDQYKEGIFSYIKKGTVCDKTVIDIIIPEKSSFFVYWNSKKSSYEYLNYLDENLCQNISDNNSKYSINNLFNNFSFQYALSQFDEDNAKQSVNLFLKNNDTKKEQEINFSPEHLSKMLTINSSNRSYSKTRDLNIKTNEGIENYNKLITIDINFDGLEDFAIINYEGGNGGPQYAYFIQNLNGQFVLDENLTENMSYFPKEINRKDKTLTIMHPSGCCNIITYILQIQPNGEWKEISSKNTAI